MVRCMVRLVRESSREMYDTMTQYIHCSIQSHGWSTSLFDGLSECPLTCWMFKPMANINAT